jgi:hypothetical protein
MAMASGVYGLTLRDVLDASQYAVDLVSDTIKIQLVTNSETPDFNAHDFEADIANEISGTNYTAGGATLASKTLTATGGLLTWDSADPSWASATFSNVRGAITWDDTVASDPLVHAVTYGADYSVTAGTFTHQVNASGLVAIDYVP